MVAPANPLPILAGILLLCIVAEFVAAAFRLPVPTGSASIIGQLVAGVLTLAIPQSRQSGKSRAGRSKRPTAGGRTEGSGQGSGGRAEGHGQSLGRNGVSNGEGSYDGK